MCSGNGTCDDGAMGSGACTCTGGFTGTDCSMPPTCSGAGDNAGDVMIVAVMYDAPNSGSSEPDGEYFILYNNSCADIDLTGWEVCDAAGCLDVGAVTIEQGKGLAVIESTGALGLGFYGCNADAYHLEGGSFFATGTWFSNNLGNSGDRVIVNNASGTQIDAMSYGSNSSIFNPALPDVSDGISLQRLGYPWSGTLPANVDATAWEASAQNGVICNLDAMGNFQ